MKIFINDGICGRIWNGNVKVNKLPDSKIKLSIPNYIESKRKHEYIDFILPDITEKDFLKDILLEDVSLKKTSKNIYHTEESKENISMYALLRSTEIVPDDIFIPASMKDRVKVMRRIRFVDGEVDYGSFLSNVYLIKIYLNLDECLPVYLASEDARVLNRHYVFSFPSWYREYRVSKKLKTMIIINDANRDEYISLSSLCK